MDKKRVTELSIIANNVRKHALTAVYSAASGHPGGSLSVADVLTLLYFEVMNVDPKNPKMEDRDRFVLSKGHTPCPNEPVDISTPGTLFISGCP